MAYSKEICQAITDFLDSDGWHYELDEERELIHFGVDIKGKLRSTKVYVDLRKDKYLVFSTVSLKADEDCRAELRDLINRINYGMIFGNFEMDDRDGEVRFRMAVDCKNCIPNRNVIENSIVIPVLMVQRYGDALLAVMMGFASGADAYKAADSDD